MAPLRVCQIGLDSLTTSVAALIGQAQYFANVGAAAAGKNGAGSGGGGALQMIGIRLPFLADIAADEQLYSTFDYEEAGNGGGGNGGGGGGGHGSGDGRRGGIPYNRGGGALPASICTV